MLTPSGFGLEDDELCVVINPEGELPLAPVHQTHHPLDVCARHNEVRMLGLNSELERLADELTGIGPPMLGHVMQEYPLGGLLVVTADIKDVPGGFEHDRNAVEFRMAGVKHVTGHAQAVGAVAQYLSNASVRSLAICWGERPSIMWRWTKCTTSPSRNSAMDGLLGA